MTTSSLYREYFCQYNFGIAFARFESFYRNTVSCDYWLPYYYWQTTCFFGASAFFNFMTKGLIFLKLLEERILSEGQVLPGNVLKIGSFLNQQIDTGLLMAMGREVARLFEGCGVTKVLTVEASGIAIAVAIGAAIGVPAVFAKKQPTGNMSGDTFDAEVYSYTHKKTYHILVPQSYISSADKVLIADDFLATGNALFGLRDIVEQAGATVVGFTTEVEKGFQGGGDKLRAEGFRVESLAVVEQMDEGRIVFRPQ